MMKEAGEKFDPKPTSGHHRLLLGEGRDALLPVQLLLDGHVDQQGRAEEGRRRRDPEDLAAVFDAGKKLKAAGRETCGFSNDWATWANIEQFSAWHNIPMATKANGLDLRHGDEVQLSGP